MNKETIIPITKSIVKKILRIKHSHSTGGGTNRSRYCYSVWLRHLSQLNKHSKGVPEVVAELGPGDSLGIGLSALISGSNQLHALDVVKYWDTKRNLKKFNDLVELFKNKTNIPDDGEFPKVIPKLEDYNFPSEILTDAVLKEALNEDRLNAIRKEILDINNPNNTFIKYHIPWSNPEIIENESVDFVYSQSVLQYIEDLDETYNAMNKWLKPSGIMSHSIDLSSVGITNNWNSHWTFSDFEWKIIKSGRAFAITRYPLSKHYKRHHKNGFKILENLPIKKANTLNKNKLSDNYKNLSEEDITTSSTYILSVKT